MLKTNLIFWFTKTSFLWEAQLETAWWNDWMFYLIGTGTIVEFTTWTDSLFLFYFLFFIGLTGILFNYKNYLVTMFCIELMYLGITVCFAIVSVSTADPKGQIYSILLLVVAAAESATGLGILIVLYRFGSSINFSDYQELKS